MRNRFPLAVLLGSVLVLSYWQFRYTEFHPVRRVFSVGNKNDFSWRNRVAAWEGSLAMMADRPVAGFGWNQPERIYDQFYRSPKLSEGMAIQLNHYFTLGMSLGLPALVCFGMYVGLALTGKAESEKAESENFSTTEHTEHTKGNTDTSAGNIQHSTFNIQRPTSEHLPQDHQPSTFNHQLKSICRAGAVVLLVGLWFDGGLFNLATAAPLWVLLELGSGTVLPACRGERVNETGTHGQDARATANPPPHVGGYAFLVSCRSCVSCLKCSPIFFLLSLLLLTGLLWAKARDPFHREWLSLRTGTGETFSAVVVKPDRGGPFPVVVWCHGSGGSMESSGETLQQFAAQGLAAVGFNYSQTNQAQFDEQFAALLEAVGGKAESGKRESGNPVTTEHTEHTKGNTDGDAENFQLSTFNLQPSLPRIAWVGNSLGAQRQLSFLARHPERQPRALVRLNGGWVEELAGKAEKLKTEMLKGEGGKANLGEGEHSTFNSDESRAGIQRSTSNDGGSLEGTENFQPSTFNSDKSRAGFQPPLVAWIAHGENDEVFPASDARRVAESLRAAGAEVRLDIFPGRGHGFGEDQPLLVRKAAEFCAKEIGGTTPVPVTVRPELFYYWLPVGLLGGVLVLRRVRGFNREKSFEQEVTEGTEMMQAGAAGASGSPLSPFPHVKTSSSVRSWSDRWVTICAVVGLIAATLVSAAHLALPLFRASPAVLKLARQWCVRPALRADFDWLAQQPGAKSCRIRDLLEHVQLAALQRGQFAASLPEKEWREFVISPWIEGAGGDIAWRRELWEWMSPRVRRETDPEQAAQIIGRELCRRVSLRGVSQSGEIRTSWSAAVADESCFVTLNVAALRSVGVASRMVNGHVELLVGEGWKPAPSGSLQNREARN